MCKALLPLKLLAIFGKSETYILYFLPHPPYSKNVPVPLCRNNLYLLRKVTKYTFILPHFLVPFWLSLILVYLTYLMS